MNNNRILSKHRLALVCDLWILSNKNLRQNKFNKKSTQTQIYLFFIPQKLLIDLFSVYSAWNLTIDNFSCFKVYSCEFIEPWGIYNLKFCFGSLILQSFTQASGFVEIASITSNARSMECLFDVQKKIFKDHHKWKISGIFGKVKKVFKFYFIEFSKPISFKSQQMKVSQNSFKLLQSFETKSI